MTSNQSNDCSDASKRKALSLCGRAAASALVIPAMRLLPLAGGASLAARPATSEAAIPVAGIALLSFLGGWGLNLLYQKLASGNVSSAEQRLRDRMGAFAWPDLNRTSPMIHLGRATEPASPDNQLAWPEFGYHDAKIKEESPFLYPDGSRQRLSMSDKEIFEEALRKSYPGLTSNPRAYARNYRDASGRDLRIVAAQTSDGRVRVAESDGKGVQAYEVHASGG